MNVPLPTFTIPAGAGGRSISSIAEEWISRFNQDCVLHRLQEGESSCAALFSADPWWRDHLALTWDLRTFHSLFKIQTFLEETLAVRQATPLQMTVGSSRFVTATSEVAFIFASFTFETNVALCSGSVKLVSCPDGSWRAWNVYTRMEELRGYVENASLLDSPDKDSIPSATAWDVVIIGAGNCGLQLSARLRTVGVRSLVLEQKEHVGGQWRSRYSTLSLHSPKSFSQFAYRPYPLSFPTYPTKDEIAEFLESYAISTHLNILTSSKVQTGTFDESTKMWSLRIVQGTQEPVSLRAANLVVATGIAGSRPVMPSLPKRVSAVQNASSQSDMFSPQPMFAGESMHSSEFSTGMPWNGRNAVVVGSGTSGHDIAEDLCRHGANVTILQRSPTVVVSRRVAEKSLYEQRGDYADVEELDRIQGSIPHRLAGMLSAQMSDEIFRIDKALRKGLERAGFQLAEPDLADLIYTRHGGYYINTGCSDLIIENKIHVVSGHSAVSYSSHGMVLSDGSELPADLVVFATGYDPQGMRDVAREILGDEEGLKLKEPWGLDEEGELNGVWKDSGHPALWYMGGDFRAARYYSKVLALQIHGALLGILSRYGV